MKLQNLSEAFLMALATGSAMAIWITFCYLFPIAGLLLMLIITTVMFATMMDRK